MVSLHSTDDILYQYLTPSDVLMVSLTVLVTFHHSTKYPTNTDWQIPGW